MSFGFDLPGQFYRLAEYVVRLLEGAAPSDLPVGTPSHLLAINLKTAGELGIEFPLSILTLADVVIE